MIHIFDGNKFKVKKYKTSDQLIKALSIDEVDNKKDFNKFIEKGIDVYCSIVPKMDTSHEDERTELMWDIYPNILEDRYWTILEEF